MTGDSSQILIRAIVCNVAIITYKISVNGIINKGQTNTHYGFSRLPGRLPQLAAAPSQQTTLTIFEVHVMSIIMAGVLLELHPFMSPRLLLTMVHALIPNTSGPH